MTDFYEGADKFLAERKVKQDALMEQAKAIVDANPTAHIHKKKVVRVRRVALNPTSVIDIETAIFNPPEDEPKEIWVKEYASAKYWKVVSDPIIVAEYREKNPKRIIHTANGDVIVAFIAETDELIIDERVAKIVAETGRFALPGNILPFGVKPGRLFKSKVDIPAPLVGGQIAEVRENVESDVKSESFVLPHPAMTSTRLGDIYADLFEPNDWPMEMALPSLVTAASVVVPRMPRPEDGSMLLTDDPMTTLFTAQIAPVHGGKTQVNQWGAKALGIYHPRRGSYYYAVKTGSAEQLFKNLSKHANTFGPSVLIDPDEWAHLLSKAGIKDASFPKILTSMFYARENTITVGGQGGGKEISLDKAVSIIGGIVQDDFGTVFGAESLGGLYDRFLFGLAPDGFKWDYRDFPREVVPFEKLRWTPVPVAIHGSVWEVVKTWNKDHKDWGRIVEVCTRIATIFASVDGRKFITGTDLEALEPLARYQMDIRSIYKPNAGLNPDAQFANAAEDWINKNAPQWRTLRDLKKGVNVYEATLGPNVAERSLYALARAGRIELWIDGRDRQGNPSPMPADWTAKGRRPTGLVRSIRNED